MSSKVITCRTCSNPFTPYPNKPGYVNQCTTCAEENMDNDVDLLGGNMVWHHKTAPELEIKYMVEAKKFAAKTRRFGFGVTCSLTECKSIDPTFMCVTKESLQISKHKTGSEDGAQYVSSLGEKRNVKR